MVKNSPAHRAGLKRGDIILEFEGKRVTESAILRNLVAQSKAGTPINLKISRDGTSFNAQVIVEQLPSEPLQEQKTLKRTSSGDNPFKGAVLVDLDPSLARQLGADPDERGVVVFKIEPGSPAEASGLRKGDLIIEIERQRINNVAEFQRALQRIKGQDILVFINRGGKKFYMILSSS